MSPENNIRIITNLNFKKMKKVFLALAVVAMFSFAACGNNAETTEEVPATEETLVEEPVQEAQDVEAAAEEVAAEAQEVVAE